MENRKILYIVGSGRSGSTLLDIILGSQNNIFSSGELFCLINSNLSSELCSCGENISKCDFWASVIDAWKQKYNLSEKDVLWFSKCDIEYSHPKKISNWLLAIGLIKSKSFDKYKIYLEGLLKTIFDFTGSDTITDSSKSPVRFLTLSRIFGNNIEAIHLVKDPYEVIHSLNKGYEKNVKIGLQRELHPKNELRTALWWIIINIMSSFSIKLSKSNSVRVNYIDMVNNTSEALECIIKNFLTYENYHSNHICAGNRMRMSESIKIRKSRPQEKKGINSIVRLVLFPFRKYYLKKNS